MSGKCLFVCVCWCSCCNVWMMLLIICERQFDLIVCWCDWMKVRRRRRRNFSIAIFCSKMIRRAKYPSIARRVPVFFRQGGKVPSQLWIEQQRSRVHHRPFVDRTCHHHNFVPKMSCRNSWNMIDQNRLIKDCAHTQQLVFILKQRRWWLQGDQTLLLEQWQITVWVTCTDSTGSTSLDKDEPMMI